MLKEDFLEGCWRKGPSREFAFSLKVVLKQLWNQTPLTAAGQRHATFCTESWLLLCPYPAET
jgi:hypothetical protein